VILCFPVVTDFSAAPSVPSPKLEPRRTRRFTKEGKLKLALLHPPRLLLQPLSASNGDCINRDCISRRYCIKRQALQAHTTGTANSMASTRSSMPPWPGRMVPESLTPAPRLIRDSTRSPN